MTEIDMDAYNNSEDKIKPGKHEEFEFHPTVHTFNERFQGEPGSLPTNEVDYDKGPTGPMPSWWAKNTQPNTKWPGEGPQFDMQENKSPVFQAQPWIMPADPDYQWGEINKISMKDEPPKMVPDSMVPMLKDMKHKDDVLGFMQQGMSNKEISDKMGLNLDLVKQLVQSAKQRFISKELPSPTSPETVPDNRIIAERRTGSGRPSLDEAEFRKDLASGMTNAELGEKYGVNPTSVKKRRDALGVQSYPRGRQWDREQSLSDWMKNQFEGAPTEPEMINSMQKYLMDKNLSQVRNPANENFPAGSKEREASYNKLSLAEKLDHILRNNPEYRQVPFGYSSKYIQSLSHEDYLKGMNTGDWGKPPDF